MAGWASCLGKGGEEAWDGDLSGKDTWEEDNIGLGERDILGKERKVMEDVWWMREIIGKETARGRRRKGRRTYLMGKKEVEREGKGRVQGVRTRRRGCEGTWLVGRRGRRTNITFLPQNTVTAFTTLGGHPFLFRVCKAPKRVLGSLQLLQEVSRCLGNDHANLKL